MSEVTEANRVCIEAAWTYEPATATTCPPPPVIPAAAAPLDGSDRTARIRICIQQNAQPYAEPAPITVETGGLSRAPPAAEHESIRIRHLRECIETEAVRQIAQAAAAAVSDACVCPVQKQTALDRQATTPSQSDILLARITECPLYYHNPDPGGGCGSGAGAGSSKGVARAVFDAAGLTGTRSHHRIRGIEEIARLARSPSSSERTARLKANLITSNRRLNRHGEHYRAIPPPPPCRIQNTGPEPGVPIARQTPCNPGTQRVDYSSPV